MNDNLIKAAKDASFAKHEAECELHSAIASLKSKIQSKLVADCRADPDHRNEILAGYADACKSNMSGGPTNVTNIVEALTRDIALHLLVRPSSFVLRD